MHRTWNQLISAICLSTIVFSAWTTVSQPVSANVVPIARKLHLDSDKQPQKASEAGKEHVGLAKEAKSAVIMDELTGKVLFEKDSHERLPMASITKIMTMLLIMESIDSGKLKYSDRIKVSDYASSMGGSQIFLEPGETMSVEHMLKGIAIASANDACVAMAEHLSGSEEAFVERMNTRAKELGMMDTHFENCNGLPAKNHYSSAHDIALMSRALLSHPQITRFTSVYSDYLRQDSAKPLWLVNTNKLVRFYEGVDGLKTGYTNEAQYCLSATAKRDGFRVIVVVMGEPKPKVRNAEVTGLLNWSFHNFTTKTLYVKDAVITTVPIHHGVISKVNVCTHNAIGIVAPRGEKVDYHTKIELFRLEAPVKKGQQVGFLNVYEGDDDDSDDCILKAPLFAQMNVDRSGFFHRLGQTIKGIVTFGKAE